MGTEKGKSGSSGANNIRMTKWVRNCGSKTFLPHRIAVKPRANPFSVSFMKCHEQGIRINRVMYTKAIYKRWELHVLSTCWVPLVRQFAISYVMSLELTSNPQLSSPWVLFPLSRILFLLTFFLAFSFYLFSSSPQSHLLCVMPFLTQSLPLSPFPALLCFIFIIVFLTNKNTEVSRHLSPY